MRVIARKERPAPRRPTADHRRRRASGHRLRHQHHPRPTQLADLELRHRRRARAEDRIRCAKDTGLTNLPLHDFDQNQIWCAIVALACELTAWMQTLALPGHPGPPVGTQTATPPAVHPPRPTSSATGRRTVLHLAGHAPLGRPLAIARASAGSARSPGTPG